MPTTAKTFDPAVISRTLARLEESRHTPANAKLRRIVRLLERASRLANDWHNEHASNPQTAASLGCDEEAAAVLAEDVEGIRWFTSRVCSDIRGIIA